MCRICRICRTHKTSRICKPVKAVNNWVCSAFGNFQVWISWTIAIQFACFWQVSTHHFFVYFIFDKYMLHYYYLICFTFEKYLQHHIWIVSLLTSISCTVIHNFWLIYFYFLFHFCLFVHVFPSISMLHSSLNSVFPQLGLFASLRIYHPTWGTLGFANWEAGLGSLMANLCM